MNEKIFRSTFLTAAVTLLAGTAMLLWVLVGFFEGQLQKELKNEAQYIALAMERNGTDCLSEFSGGNARITWIDSDGNVLADTGTDSGALDNHAEREEVKEALKSGEGVSSRYSDTLTEKTVYYAMRLEDGTILRLSVTQYTVVQLLMEMTRPLLIAAGVALLFSLVLSMRVSDSILRPINELDLENPSANETYEELTPLLHKLTQQKATIKRQLADAYQKQKEFRLITENMTEGVLVIDQQMNLLSSNQAARRLLNAGEANQIGSVLILNRTRPFRTAIEKALGGQRAECRMEQGKSTYQLIASPVHEEERTIAAVVLLLDVTESVRGETLRREFTANVSHELKTPLTSISGFAELIAAGGTPEETVRDFARSIYEEAQRLVSLVGDIIKISELDEKDSAIEKETVSLYDLCRETAVRLRPEADKHGISITLSGEQNTQVFGARKILGEMIDNLCDNAVKYNKDGGSVNLVTEMTEDGGARLIVSDTGIGIPEEDQKRVFERFFRVDKSRSKAAGGTGLGLSIVKHGALYHGAGVKLESSVGEGTRVTITFPPNRENEEESE